MPGQRPTLIAVLESESLVRFALRCLLTEAKGFSWVGEASTVRDILLVLNDNPCDILVLDYELALREVDGFAVMRSLGLRFPATRMLALTRDAGLVNRYRAQLPGFKGAVLKTAPLETFEEAVTAVRSGVEYFLSPPTSKTGTLGEDELMANLSLREADIFRCLLKDMTVTAIAQKFRRSVKTISTQKRAVYKKMGVKTDQEFRSLHWHSNSPARVAD